MSRVWQSERSLATRGVERPWATCLREHQAEAAGLEGMLLRQQQLHRDRRSLSDWQRPTARQQRRPGRIRRSGANQSRLHRGHPQRCRPLEPLLQCWRQQCSPAPLLRDQRPHRSRPCLIRWSPRMHRIRSQLPLPSQQFRCLAQDRDRCVAESRCQTMLRLTAQTQVGLIKPKATNPCGSSLIRPFAVNLAAESCSSCLGKDRGSHPRHRQAPALECHLAQLILRHVRIALRVRMEMGATARQSACSMRYRS